MDDVTVQMLARGYTREQIAEWQAAVAQAAVAQAAGEPQEAKRAGRRRQA